MKTLVLSLSLRESLGYIDDAWEMSFDDVEIAEAIAKVLDFLKLVAKLFDRVISPL